MGRKTTTKQDCNSKRKSSTSRRINFSNVQTEKEKRNSLDAKSCRRLLQKKGKKEKEIKKLCNGTHTRRICRFDSNKANDGSKTHGHSRTKMKKSKKSKRLTKKLAKGKGVQKRTRPPSMSPSTIDTFLSCRRKAWYHKIRRITLKTPKLALELGSLWHKILDSWYTWGKKEAALKVIRIEIRKNIREGFSAFSSPTSASIATATLKGMFLGYLERYGKKDLKIWKWRKGEHEFTIDKFLGTSLTFQGIIDGVIEIKKGKTKGLWVIEHKTTKDLSYTTVDSIKVSNQTLGYIYAVQKLLGVKPKGIIWNAIRKPSKRLKKNQTINEYCTELEEDYIARPDFYFFRQQLFINKSAIATWLEEKEQVALDMGFCYDNPEEKKIWYKNTDICGMYGGCEFAPLCFRGEKRSTLLLYHPIIYRK